MAILPGYSCFVAAAVKSAGKRKPTDLAQNPVDKFDVSRG